MSTPGRAGGGGVPDGLIVGILGLLLGTTGAVWLATEAAEFATHGHAPHPLRFSATPVAIRHLATAPNDLPAAWPDTPAGQLPSPTAFWLSFFLLLVALLLLFLATLALRARFAAPRGGKPTAPLPPQRGPADPPGVQGGATASGAWARRPAAQEPPGSDVPSAVHPGARIAPQPYAAEPAVGREAPPPAASAHGRGHPAPGPSSPPLRPASGPVSAGLPDVPSGTSETWGEAPAPQGTATPAGPAQVPPPAPRAWGARAGMGGPGGAGLTCVLVPEVGARSAKREVLAEAARKAPGALVVVTADRALWEQRPAHRDAALYDPGHLLADTTGLAWAPEGGCTDPAVAAARARALLAPALRPGTDGTDAEAALAAWLEAAAREGRSIRHVARRAARPDAPEPVRAALACLEELHVLKSCLPSGSPQDDGLDLDDVVAGRRPLYLFGAASEARVRAADHSTMPLLTALLDELLTRLPAKATLVLDDIAAVAPAPGLPRLVDRGADLTTVLTLRSFEQARARWSEDVVHSLWTTADHRATVDPGPPPGLREWSAQ